MASKERHLWFQTPWPIHGVLLAIAVGWVLLFGNPLELQERQWVDQSLKWGFAGGFTKAVDERILHLDITESDLALLPTIQSEYEAASQLIREATDPGAEWLVL